MDEAGLAELAGIVGAGGAALAVLAGRRATLLAGFGLLALAEALLAVSIAGTGALDKAASAAAVGAGAGGLVVVALAAAVFVRFPLLTIPALVVAAPFRPPLDFDREYRFFFALAEGGRLGRLIPLYAVLTASAAAFLYRTLRRNEIVAPPRLIAVPTAAFLAFASLSLLWSHDIEAGANLLAFFLLPFAALVAIVARADLAPWLPRALAVIAIGLASAFAAFGLWQQVTKDLLFYEPKLEVANAYSPFFRVTSFFTDPSLYGRHVVLGFAVLLVLLWAGKISVALAAPLMVLLFAGLYFSYSQSSMAALFVVTAAVTIVAGDRLARRIVLVATAVAVLVAAGFVGLQARDQSIRELTSGRWQRAELTLDVVREQPLIGVGLGAQPKVSRELSAGRRPRGAVRVAHDAAHGRRGARPRRLRALRGAAAGGDQDARAAPRDPADTRARTGRGPPRALHALTCLQRLLRGPDHLAHTRRRRRVSRGPGACPGTGPGPRRQRDDREPTTRAEQVTRREAGAVLGVLGILVAITVPELGSEAWPFRVRSGGTDPQGPFGWLVRAADRDFDIALLRSAALVAGLVVALSAAVVLARRTVPTSGRTRDLRGRRRAPDPAGDLPPGRSARRDRAVVPRQ